MVDAGIVKATFIIDSRNMVKGLNDITKNLKGMEGTTKGLGNNFGKFGNNLSESEKVVKKLERSTAMSNLELQKMLHNTKLNNQQRNEFIETHRTLKRGLDAGNISMGQYNKSVATLSKNYGLAYKNGKVFDDTMQKQAKSAKQSSKMMRELFLNTQLTNKDKVFGTNATNIDNFNRGMKQANREIRAGTMGMNEYNRVRQTLAKLNNLQVKNNGLVYDSKTIAGVNNSLRTFVELDRAKILSMQRGIPITQYHNQMLESSKKSLSGLETWKRAGIITQSQYNDITRRLSTTYENHARNVGSLSKSYGTLANSTNMVTRSQRMQNYAMQVSAMRYNAVGVAIGSMGGLMVGLYMQQFTMARMQSIKLDQQMQQMFQTMKLGKGAFDNFNKALDDYVAKVPKISKYTVGSTIAQVGKLNNLSLEQMKAMIPLTGDMVNMMQLNGRTAEDTMLAINDAFDGQFKRLQEIGVQGKEQLKQFGYDGSADSLIKALTAISNQKGWGDLSKNVSTASDAFMILGNALDRIIVPAINLLTPAIVAISVAIADVLGWLNSMPPVVQGLATVLMIAGGAFAFMKIQMAWARMMGSQFMAEMTGLDQGMQRVTNTIFSAREVNSMLPAEFDATARSMAKVHHETQTGTKTWEALTMDKQKDVITTQKAKLQYDTLNRTQKAQINTMTRMKDITREQAMIDLFGADAVNKNTIAQTGNVSSKQSGLLATIKQTWAKTVETGATTTNTSSIAGNSVMTVINTQVKNMASIATKGLATAYMFLTSTMGIALIGIVAVVGAIYLLTATQRQGIDTMKAYNDFMQNGEEKIESLKNASENYKNKAKELEDQRARMVAQGYDTTNIEDQIAQAYKNSALMATEAKNAEEALKVGREKGDEITARNLVDRSSYLNKQNDLLRERGLIDDVAYENGKLYNSTVLAGTDKMYTALQRTNRIRNIGEMQTKKIVNGEHDYSRAFIENQKNGGKALQDRVKAYDELAEAKYKAETADDWSEASYAWAEQGILRLKIGWIDTVMQFEQFKITLGSVYNDMAEWWNGLTDWGHSINETLIAGMDGFFAYIGGAWGNTVAFFTGIGQGIYNALKPIYCIIMGCSPGIVPAMQWMYQIAVNVFGMLLTFLTSNIANIKLFVLGGWQYLVGVTQNTWNTVKNTIFNVFTTIWTKINTTVSNVKNAFIGMKNSLVNSAKNILTGVWDSYLKPLLDNIKSFWSTITNPGKWFGGSAGSGGSAGVPGSAGAPKTTGYAGGGSVRTNNGTRTSRSNNLFSGIGTVIRSQAREAINNSGMPKDPRFRGYAGIDSSSARRIENPYECEEKYGKKCYAGGWDFASNWIGKLKEMITGWSANIFGSSISVMDLANGQGNLKIFEALAGKLIGGTKYDFYYNGRYSDKEALQRGAFNCWDGAEILIDLARAIGLNANMGRGSWNGYGHVWAVVNGKNFDTTAFQHGHGWTSPSVKGYAGSPFAGSVQTGSNLKVECDFTGATFIGMEDVERQMDIVAKKAFNKLVGKNIALGV